MSNTAIVEKYRQAKRELHEAFDPAINSFADAIDISDPTMIEVFVSPFNTMLILDEGNGHYSLTLTDEEVKSGTLSPGFEERIEFPED